MYVCIYNAGTRTQVMLSLAGYGPGGVVDDSWKMFDLVIMAGTASGCRALYPSLSLSLSFSLSLSLSLSSLLSFSLSLLLALFLARLLVLTYSF